MKKWGTKRIFDACLAGCGLILSSPKSRWTIICVDPQGQQRKEEFKLACRFFEKKSGNRIDSSLKEMENLPEPDVIASEIVENLEFAMEQFKGIVEDLES